LANWQITPDASVTPYPTPTTLDALPTWADFPTIAFPTRVTRTPFPTLVWEDLTTTPIATATPYTMTLDTNRMFGDYGDLNATINYTQVYTAGYMLTGSVAGPIRVLRGTVRQYMPSLAVLIDAILIMLFIIVIVYAIKLILSLGGAIIKLVEVILEFIPL
jgi:hypothetical protein